MSEATIDHAHNQEKARLDLLWVSLADQRAGREMSWLTTDPRNSVSAVGTTRIPPPATWIPGHVNRPVKRFVEAGALAWYDDTSTWPTDVDLVGSLEPISLVTGQVSRWATKYHVPQFVVTWENDAWQPLYRLPPYRQALRETLESADLFVCPIRASADHLRTLGVEPSRIAVVPPGVDLELFTPAAHPVTEPVIVFASPLAKNKGIDRILAALPAVKAAIPDVQLRVMGQGPLEPALAKARALGLPVEYCGFGGPEDVASFLRTGAVFCTAPRPTWKWNEQFGLAYLEAMATGLPVVTTRCGTNHEAVRPPNALVGDDVDEVADGLITFLRDAERRVRVGEANRALVLRDHDILTQSAHLSRALARVVAS